MQALNLICKYIKISPKKIVYSDWKNGDIKNFNVSNKKLINLGFQYNFDFNKGIKKTIESFL